MKSVFRDWSWKVCLGIDREKVCLGIDREKVCLGIDHEKCV